MSSCSLAVASARAHFAGRTTLCRARIVPLRRRRRGWRRSRRARRAARSREPALGVGLAVDAALARGACIHTAPELYPRLKALEGATAVLSGQWLARKFGTAAIPWVPARARRGVILPGDAAAAARRRFAHVDTKRALRGRCWLCAHGGEKPELQHEARSFPQHRCAWWMMRSKSVVRFCDLRSD